MKTNFLRGQSRLRVPTDYLLSTRGGFGQALSDDLIDRWIEGQAYMSAVHLEVGVAVVGCATTPVDDSIFLSLDGGLQDGGGHATSQ